MVALEPSTGEILAMVSTPSYDPNRLASHDGAAQTATWEQLRDDPNDPLVNRAISETYPPGSTFKLVATAAALQDGATPDTQLTAAPRITLPDSTATLENYGGSACGTGPTASLREAFARSCNTAFVELGVDSGRRASCAPPPRRSGSDSAPTSIPLQVAESTIGPIRDVAALGSRASGSATSR